MHRVMIATRNASISLPQPYHGPSGWRVESHGPRDDAGLAIFLVMMCIRNISCAGLLGSVHS